MKKLWKYMLKLARDNAQRRTIIVIVVSKTRKIG